MANFSLDQFGAYQNIHFIGIGGIGISALARILKKYNHKISGSDLSTSHNLDLLERENFIIFRQHQAKNVAADTNLVIHTIAIPDNNPELIRAKELNIPILTYPQAVGLLTKCLKTVSIAGTHGKTTTTAMTGLAFEKNNADPNVIVGSLLNNFDGKNFRAGDSQWLILESCEYHDSFLNYYPNIAILTNIDHDHHDYFITEEQYLESFYNFLSRLPEDGALIANIDDRNIRKLLEHNWPFKIITFGQTDNADFQIKDHSILTPHKILIEPRLQIPGLHNLYNAAAVLALSETLQFNLQLTLNAIQKYNGAARRFEKKGHLGKALIIDDYGHHPTELLATFNSCREIMQPDQKILCVFQPHQYSRTFKLLNNFIDALGQADQVYIPNIYTARDTDEDKQKISPEKLVNLINQKYPGKAIYTEDLPKTAALIKQNADKFDIILTQGAGDITNLSNLLILN